MDRKEKWDKYGPIAGYILVGMIIAHNQWHMPFWTFSKGWATVAFEYVQPEINDGYFANRGWN